MNTSTYRHNGNTGFRDEDYSAPVGGSMWEDCPVLAAMQDPDMAHVYFNDFYTYTAADWTISTTEGGAGAATEALTDEAGGVLLITNDNLNNDSYALQKAGEAFCCTANKPFWLEGRFKTSFSTVGDFFFGLNVTDTTLIDGGQDGVWFQKDDGDANIDWGTDKDNTASGGDTGVDLSAGAWIRLGIKWDGAATVSFWIDGEQVAASSANINDNELMRISFEIQNGTTDNPTLSVDYIKAFQIR